jgi:hypothetical protein
MKTNVLDELPLDKRNFEDGFFKLGLIAYFKIKSFWMNIHLLIFAKTGLQNGYFAKNKIQKME